MSEFVERLNELMQINGFNQVALEKVSGIRHTNISDFLSGKHLPSYDNIIKLSEVFNCSIDFLLGKAEFSSEESFYSPPTFSIRLRQILKENGVSQEKLKKDLNVSGSVLYKWLKGTNKPSAESLIALSNYFDCSIDYLIGRTR